MKASFSKTLLLIVVAAVGGFILNLVFADSLVARMGTWHWVQKYHLVSPRAPLVINTREEVRVSDTADTIATMNRSKTKVAAVVSLASGVPTLRGAAVAVTADGTFLSVNAAVAGDKVEDLSVVTNDGKRFGVTGLVSDPVTGGVFLKTKAALSVVSFAARQDLQAGERVLLLGSLTDGGVYVLASFLASGEHITSGTVSSDGFARELYLQSFPGLVPGQVALDLSGRVVGLWDGQRLVSASVLDQLVGNFLGHNGTVVRPAFGFMYRYVSTAEAATVGGVAGMLVAKPEEGKVAVLPGSAANRAGLLEGDVIIKIAGQEVGDVPDALLLGLSPKTKTTFEISRAGKTITLDITPSQQ